MKTKILSLLVVIALVGTLFTGTVVAQDSPAVLSPGGTSESDPPVLPTGTSSDPPILPDTSSDPPVLPDSATD